MFVTIPNKAKFQENCLDVQFSNCYSIHVPKETCRISHKITHKLITALLLASRLIYFVYNSVSIHIRARVPILTDVGNCILAAYNGRYYNLGKYNAYITWGN